MSPAPSAATQARLRGRYTVLMFQIRTNVAGTDRVLRAVWRATPICRIGACDVTLRSLRGDRYAVRAVLQEGRYFWTRHLSHRYWCQMHGPRTRSFLPSVGEYALTPVRLRSTGASGVVTRFTGVLDSHALGTAGCDRARETYVIRGVRREAE